MRRSYRQRRSGLRHPGARLVVGRAQAVKKSICSATSSIAMLLVPLRCRVHGGLAQQVSRRPHKWSSGGRGAEQHVPGLVVLPAGAGALRAENHLDSRRRLQHVQNKVLGVADDAELCQLVAHVHRHEAICVSDVLLRAVDHRDELRQGRLQRTVRNVGGVAQSPDQLQSVRQPRRPRHRLHVDVRGGLLEDFPWLVMGLLEHVVGSLQG
mmetsp:Transcript_55356/g.160384  ORF Transcript_55356/g.160384 Transcript_55356/m.160384 type:complete len:210 (+) Transcript_55356:1385-2014(+)